MEYKAPIRFDEEIEVGVRVPRIGSSSLIFELGIFGKGEGQPRATGENIWVNTNQSTHRPVPVPDQLVELIRGLEGAALELARPG